MSTDRWFERLADATEQPVADRAPARLKSRVYSALVSRMAESGPLLDLGASSRAGGRLCVFEACLTPLGEAVASSNPCRACHARVLGERLEHAPIFWPGCPYAQFHRGSS
jgi:hypothetical protein